MTKPEHVGGDRYRVRRRIGGKQRSRYFHASSKSAANRAAAKHLAELDAEADRWQARQGTIAHLIDDWKAVTWPDRSPSTIRGYKGHVRLILDEFGHRQAATITHRELTAWYGKLRADGKGTGAVKHLHTTLSAIMRFGVRHWDLPRAPTEVAMVPVHRAPEIDAPTPQLVRHILATAQGEFGRALTVLAHLGLRRGEVVGLKWDGVTDEAIHVVHSVLDREGGGVIVKGDTKTHKSRWVIATAGVRRALREQFIEQSAIGQSDYVFPNWRYDTTGATPKSPNWMSQAWERHRKALGVRGVRLHDLRHAYATVMLDDGVPVNVVQEQLGHSKPSTTTDIYGHSGAKGLEAARAALMAAYDDESSAP